MLRYKHDFYNMPKSEARRIINGLLEDYYASGRTIRVFAPKKTRNARRKTKI